jgi:hypothetical protein
MEDLESRMERMEGEIKKTIKMMKNKPGRRGGHVRKKGYTNR